MPSQRSPLQALSALAQRHHDQPFRRFHTWARICLLRQQTTCTREKAVQLALLYHASAYVPGAPQNGVRSAELLQVDAGSLGFEGALVAQAGALILGLHANDCGAPEARCLWAATHLWLAQPWGDFTRDADAIRAEFRHLRDDEFEQGQARRFARILAHLRAQPTCLPAAALDTASQNLSRWLMETSAG